MQPILMNYLSIKLKIVIPFNMEAHMNVSFFLLFHLFILKKSNFY